MTERLDREISDFKVALPESWEPMPLGDDAPPQWADELAARLVPADEFGERMLAMELTAAQAQFASMEDPRIRAAVWVPFPETGRASAAMIFLLADRASVGSPDEYEAFLASYADRTSGEESYYSVSTWRSSIDAGDVVGSHNLIAHTTDDPEAAQLEERVVISVFPPATSEVVQFIFSAEGLGSFTNMPQQCFEFVAGLEIQAEETR